MTDEAPICFGKEGFSDRSKAEKAAKRIRRFRTAEGKKIEAYRCRCCPMWHIGRSSRELR